MTDTGAAAGHDEGVSPQEAFGIALDLIGREEYGAARQLLVRILEIVPDYPEALNVLAILTNHFGDPASALQLLKRAAELAPDHPGILNNLGNMLIEMRDDAGAVEAYKKAARLAPDDPDPIHNLASVTMARGDLERAERLLRHALHLRPDMGAAHKNLALILMATDRRRESMNHFWKATRFLPSERTSPHVRALAFDWNGEKEGAIAVLEDWLERDPENPEVKHLLAALIEGMTPDRAPDEVVERIFDRFADSFEKKLADLEYRAPELVGEAVARFDPAPSAALSILDAGCGTGLCGPYLRPHAAHLVGVDLSAGMIAEARKGGSYDELAKGELTAFIGERKDDYDLIVSADTLCYFGRIDEVAQNAFAALRPGGAFIFTVEALLEDTEDRFRLGLSGRYTHRRDYVREALTGSGLDIDEIADVTLRMENHEPVAGFLVTARRPAA